MIDFSRCEVNRYRAYGGANGNKINIRYNGEGYMLKFPPVPTLNKNISYTNSCISEYLSCHIFEMLGLRAQETLLGTYTDQRGRQKVIRFILRPVTSWPNMASAAQAKRLAS